MVKILTMCSRGLCRSVGLADVLKQHFEPVDVIPIGYTGNTEDTRKMLMDWADKIVVMEAHMVKYVDEVNKHKALVCEVGRDTYGNPRNRLLIDMVWQWTRQHTAELGITEHDKRL